jgi:hypothetical protein
MYANLRYKNKFVFSKRKFVLSKRKFVCQNANLFVKTQIRKMYFTGMRRTLIHHLQQVTDAVVVLENLNTPEKDYHTR